MIVVKVELHHALTRRVTRLLTMTISNRGDHPKRPYRGNYVVRMGRKGQEDIRAIHASPFKTATVENYPRKALHVRYLIERAFTAITNTGPSK